MLLGNSGLLPHFNFQVSSDPTYLLQDEFTTDLAAGAVNGTAAEPGPGTRTITDGNSKLTISGGLLSFATGGVTAGNPGLWFGTMTRTPGLLCVGQVTHTSQGVDIGFDGNQASSITTANRVQATNLQILRNAAAITVGAVSTSTSYRLLIVLRATGAYHFISGGAFTNPTLIYINDSVSAAVFPGITAVGTTSVATSDYLRVISSGWLPAPLASDGFGSTFGTTDGLGHAEGIAGGVGAGGGSATWTQQAGTWTNTSGTCAASALSGGLALATITASTSDVIATAALNRSAGNVGLVVRYVDSSNYVLAYHNGTNALLVKRVAGVDTTMINTAATYAAGAELRVIVSGTAYRLYYNNVAISTEQTIADTVFSGATKFGLYTTDTGNTLDNFAVYARGTGGEYSNLDVY